MGSANWGQPVSAGSEISNAATANPVIRKLEQGAPLALDDHTRLAQVTARVRHFVPDKVVFSQGDAPANVYAVLQGFACRYTILAGGKRSILGFLVPGDFCIFCDDALLDHLDYSVSTLTPCILAEIPRATAEELIGNHPAIAFALRRAALVDEAILRKWLTNAGHLSSGSRLAHLLCELRLRLGMMGLVSGDAFRFPVTQEELGDALGSSAVHVNRSLQKLRRAGLIHLRQGLLKIPDPTRLEAYAEFHPDYLHLTQRAMRSLSDFGVASRSPRLRKEPAPISHSTPCPGLPAQ